MIYNLVKRKVMNKKSVFGLAKTIAVGYVSFLVLQIALLLGVIAPFASATLFALCFLLPEVSGLCTGYFLAGITLNTGLGEVVQTLFVASVAMLVKTIYKVKPKTKPYVTFVLYCFSFVAKLLLEPAKIYVLIEMFVGLALLYVFVMLFAGVVSKGLFCKYALDEKMGAFALVAGLALGLYSASVKGVNLLAVGGFFALGFMAVLGLGSKRYFVAVSMGVGAMLSNLSPVFLALFTITAVLVGTTSNKLIVALCLILSSVLAGTCLKFYEPYSFAKLIEVGISAVLVLALPKKLVKKLIEKSNISKATFASSYLIDSDLKQVKRKLFSISEAFFKLDRIYKDMVIGELDQDEVAKLLAEDLSHKTCASCERCKNCYLKKPDAILSALNDFCKVSLQKGKANLVDVPACLAPCAKLSSLLAEVNVGLVQYENYSRRIKKEDAQKTLIGNQLLGAGKLISSLGTNLKRLSRADEATEKALIDELLYNRVLARECIVYEDEVGFCSSIIVLNSGAVTAEALCYITSKFFGIKTKVEEFGLSRFEGYAVAKIVRAPKYEIAVGVCTMGKNGAAVNGDSHTYVPLGDGKFLFALADGKGNGSTAQSTSEKVISLIESYYKSGVSVDIALSSIMSTLSYAFEENFSTLDVCVVDAKDGTADFIKFGSSPSIIKSRKTASLLSAESLPIGTLEKTEATRFRQILSAGDIVVLASDGVADSFGDAENFLSYTASERLNNMDMLANSLVEESIKNYGGEIKDDMTALCFRVV